MTIFFRRLADVPTGADVAAEARLTPLREAFYAPAVLEGEHGRALADWLLRYTQRVRDEAEPGASRICRMQRSNPKYVLRNWIAQQAIDAAAQGDMAPTERLLELFQRPYDEQPEHEAWFARRPEWARHKPGCSALSCSS